MDGRRLGQVRVTFEVLGQWLKLPPDHKVVAATWDFVATGARAQICRHAVVVVEGPSMPGCAEGSEPMLVSGDEWRAE